MNTTMTEQQFWDAVHSAESFDEKLDLLFDETIAVLASVNEQIVLAQ
jgi:hypothetical protein